MPCYQVRLARIELTGQTDRNLLMETLKAMDGNPIMLANGQIRFTMNNRLHTIDANNTLITNDATIADKIKVGYGAQVVKATAKKFGWQVKTTAGNKFEVSRSSF